jgi:purine-binding chemotaxis protein CheW
MPVKRQMVIFRIGGEEFAIDIDLTKEIVTMRPITPIPETEDYVLGVMNLRGNLVPVLDLRRRLRAGAEAAGSAKGQPDIRIIIARVDGKQTGLVVDGASEVIRVTDEMIEPPPDVIAEIGADYIGGIINLNDRFITVLDLDRALKGEVTHELEEVRRLMMMGGVGGQKAPALA